MDENQIRQLVDMVRQGDQRAFESLYGVTKNSVYFICVSFMKNEEDAKDVMQDTYMTAYNYLYQLNDGGKFLPWINQIAVNKCKRQLTRRQPVSERLEEAENVALEENVDFIPESYIDQKEKRELVMKIMQRELSEVQYDTILLHYFCGMSVGEIAQIMECPEGTVKYRLSVARGKLKAGIIAYEKNSGDKLYSLGGVPVLTYILYAEANEIMVPNVLPGVLNGVMSEYVSVASNQMAEVAIGASNTGTVSQVSGVVGTSSTEIIGTAAQTAGKVGLGIMKKKIIIGIATLAVVGTGVAAAVGIGRSGSKEDKKSDITIEVTQDQDAFMGDDNTTEKEDTEATAEFDGNWEKEEEYGYSPYWLKYANLSSYGKKDIGDVMIYDKFAIADSAKDILSLDWHHYDIYDETGFSITTVYSYDELINFDGEIAYNTTKLQPKGHSNNYIEIYAYENEDRTGATAEIVIYNMTDKEASIKECIENNSYELFGDGELLDFAMLGANLDDADFRSNMTKIIETLGTPDELYCESNANVNTDREDADETPEETIEYGGGFLVYMLLYDKGDYCVEIECCESNYFGNYEGYGKISVYSKDVFEEHIKDNYPYEASVLLEIK